MLRNSFTSFEMDPISRFAKYAQLHKHVQESIDIIEKAIAKYTLDNTCVSFNGGKDCTAVLHLVHSISRRLCRNNNNQSNITAFYAQLPDHFQEEDRFVQETVKHYNLKLLQYSGSSLKGSLAQLKSDAPKIEAIFIGTRIDDLKPGSIVSTVSPTDGDWPKFMRINPILNWSYGQVWEYLRDLDIPYCDLYNQGYSSLGTRNDTTKNSSLLRVDESGKQFYLPAWKLTSEHEERSSRSTFQQAIEKSDNSKYQ